MINGSKKGKFYEWQLVQKFKDKGMQAERAWNSDGKSLGKHHEVDILVQHEGREYLIQAKRRKKISTFLTPSKEVDFHIMKGDRESDIVAMSLPTLFRLLENQK